MKGHGKQTEKNKPLQIRKGRKDKQYIKEVNQRQKGKQRPIKAHEEEIRIAADNMKGI